MKRNKSRLFFFLRWLIWNLWFCSLYKKNVFNSQFPATYLATKPTILCKKRIISVSYWSDTIQWMHFTLIWPYSWSNIQGYSGMLAYQSPCHSPVRPVKLVFYFLLLLKLTHYWFKATLLETSTMLLYCLLQERLKLLTSVNMAKHMYRAR